MRKRRPHFPFAHSVAALPLVALSVTCLGACSSTTTSRSESETGGGGSGAMGTTGGTVETGGSTTGGIATNTGGVATNTGGISTGGIVTNTGGIATETGGTAVGGAPTGGTATGGISPTGGSSATGGMGETGGDVGAGGATGGVVGDTGGSSGTGGEEATGGAATTDRSPGCGTALDRPNPREQQTIDVDGETRYYLLDVPAGADNETPLMLIFGLHGYDMNNVSLIDSYNFTQRSNGQAITVLPQGEGPPPGDTSHWGDNVLKSTWTNASYPFIEALIADIEDRFCVDPRRVFIAGFSMGGMFTNSIACDHSDWFRGFAPIEGAGPNSCANADAQPAIMIHHGTTDDILGMESGEATRDFWVSHNGCTQTSTSSFTGCETYDGCPDASPVVFCVGNWGHWVHETAAGNIWSFFSGLEVE